jgi:uroporphyrin-3 C-methyltransferase
MNREIKTAPPESSYRITSILLFIIFITIAILAGQWVDRRDHIIGIQRSIAEYIDNVDFFGKKPRQLIAEVQAAKEKNQKQLNKLSVEVIASQDQQEMIEKLLNLIEKIDALPFAMDTHLIKVDFSLEQLIPPQNNRWYKFINDVWQDLQQFVIVQKVDNPGIELLSPSQRKLLQENIKLQLVLAQSSLLSHDQTSFQENLETAINWINHHYDKQAGSVIDLLNQLDQLHSYTIGEATSNVSKRLDTVRNYQLIQ